MPAPPAGGAGRSGRSAAARAASPLAWCSPAPKKPVTYLQMATGFPSGPSRFLARVLYTCTAPSAVDTYRSWVRCMSKAREVTSRASVASALASAMAASRARLFARWSRGGVCGRGMSGQSLARARRDTSNTPRDSSVAYASMVPARLTARRVPPGSCTDLPTVPLRVRTLTVPFAFATRRMDFLPLEYMSRPTTAGADEPRSPSTSAETTRSRVRRMLGGGRTGAPSPAESRGVALGTAPPAPLASSPLAGAAT
mmetsp:Transcript_19367/g.61461  ORF Transcript_19367/g.61461 Transcript_19367/m.61461 type:complete len:255 (-) Transcript_19367:798-1562(-)